jgi:ribonuclease III
VVKQEGSAHEPVFTVEVRVPNLEPATARGGSKREAEKLAADLLLTKALNSSMDAQ